MITITLNFKSIEAARQALLDIPSSALVGGPEPEAEAPKPAPDQEAEAPKPVKASRASKTAAEPVVAQPQTTAGREEAPAPAAAAAQTGPAPSVDYPTLQKAVFTLAGKSREAAAAVAASFGVKTFKDLPSDKWADALTAVNAKLAELEGV